MVNTVFFDELYRQYSWYDSIFTPIVKECSNEFFFEGLEYKLFSISTNMNILAQDETFFVTKVKINAKNDVYIRISRDAINVILDKVLGKNNRKFDLTDVSDLEARIITSFNDFLYETMKSNFTIEANKRYSEIVHLTYFVKSEISDKSAKFIISLPKDILTPVSLEQSEPHFEDRDFADSLVEVNLHLGKTVFPVADLKRLDIGDIVVFEDSNSSEMTLMYENIIQKFQVNPNTKIVQAYDTRGGNMENNSRPENLWDSIQVDMNAEFDKVKVTLGELKNIEEGLIVDLCSVYDNKVSLKVGGKYVASGELIIINDRFGVRVDKLNDNYDETQTTDSEEESSDGDYSQQATGDGSEEFDYSDFEVDN